MNKSKSGVLKASTFAFLLVYSFNIIAIAKEKEEDSIITKLCLISFNSEVRSAKTKAPEGVAIFTCNCFTKEVSSGTSIDLAQEVCKKKAIKKFNL